MHCVASCRHRPQGVFHAGARARRNTRALAAGGRRDVISAGQPWEHCVYAYQSHTLTQTHTDPVASCAGTTGYIKHLGQITTTKQKSALPIATSLFPQSCRGLPGPHSPPVCVVCLCPGPTRVCVCLCPAYPTRLHRDSICPPTASLPIVWRRRGYS